MRFRNLLVIAPAFPDSFDRNIEGIFIKEQIKYIKDNFSQVSVIAPCTIWGRGLLRGNEPYLWGNVRVYYPLIANIPSPYVPTALKRIYIQREANAIMKLLKSERIDFDLIHAHYTWYPGAVALELRRRTGTPVVITEHTSLTLQRALKREDPYFISTWRDCDAIVSVNRRNAAHLQAFNKASIYVPNGFDEQAIYPQDKGLCRGKMKINDNIKVILSIGSLDNVKGHKYLIDAMRRLVVNRKDILCLIAGAGPLKGWLQKKIDDLELGGHVKLMGLVSRRDISTLINTCDLFVLPSLSESFGIVQIEAMACGKPVVATRNGGSEEIIISDEFGYLVDPADDMELAEKISRALDREWDGENIIKYSSQFSWERIAERIILIYEQLDDKD